ncbi:leucine-rich repeat-containing protein 9 [Lingula anatina]|uniref:Leucine-rich repeat-containing protein 9 n=1 Tax=Lingula anatina TaxID=7574 RepID=A0A1S3IEP9_LINAN|nr:leucine-rich repeat-containing protein 9 [Lingula anatina]|eukprot:XP_013396331.1 leucine-rich repeat-containing protein 9 [Lingula anatina]
MSETTKKTKTREEEDRELFLELCTNNGINNAAQEGPSVQLIEMFFSGYPRIIGMHNFPNLQCLCIIGQSIQRIDGVMRLTKLKELWIAECELKKIEGLGDMKQLQKLYLYANQIEKIENLDRLTQLEVIWLNGNNIKNIDGLTNLKKLIEVNLAENQIQKLGHSLDNLVNLENLNLSGNKLYSFKDITSLVRLPKLTHLGLKDPNFAPCPVALLCNYSTHVLYHLPGLLRLDTYDVSSKQLKAAAEGTVTKKKMYYTMRMKTVRRKQADQLLTLKKTRDEVYYKHPHERIKALWFSIKEIDRELVDMKQRSGHIEDGHESGTESDKDARAMEVEMEQTISAKLDHKQEALRHRMNHWEEKCDEIDFHYNEAITKTRQAGDTEVTRLITELETGGNVRYEDGKPTDVWFTSCHDLILSRFCAVDYREFGIQGIMIHRITRVHNRILRTRFDDKLSTLLDDDDSYLPSTRSGSHKKLIEYLFWVWDPELPGGTSEPARVLEEGFLDSDTYRQLGKDAAVPLTNSLSLADRLRIDHLKKAARSKPYKEPCPFRHGHVVVCKVYLGRNSQALDTKIQRGHYPKVDSVFKPRKISGKGTPKSEALHGQACECSTRQCEWFIFDHELVVPEYVIDFEYITRVKPTHPFACVDVGELGSKATEAGDSNVDADVLMMEPIIKPRPRFITITDELVLKVANCDNLINVTELNLHGNGLNRLRNLNNVPNLKKLIVSFNELTKLDDIAHLPLEYVDASFNKIATLEGMKNMSKLKFLDLSWNHLFSTREELAIIRKHCPSLAQLDIRHNQWQKPDGLRLRAIGRLKALTVLDGIPVTESEATAALRMAAGSRISQVSLLTHSRTDTVRPRSLNLSPCSLVLSQFSRFKPDRLGEQDNEWYAKVTSLNLDGQHISKLSNLERLENLKWASFNDNDLTRIEGLDSCTNLEELCLENNCLTKIEGLAKLTKLQKLLLGHNYITTLDNVGLDKMNELVHLSVENNRLTSLVGVQRITGLMELYVGNNLISNIRDIFYLKNLSNFLILEMYGNPVVSETDNYRLFVIYHLKPLKALDGLAIEASEASQAKDLYGGRLTLDFVAEKVGHSNFNEVRELDFPNASVRTVDLGNGQYFHNLRSVNLEHNNLSSFSGLIYLVNLRVLCLNHNHVECIVPRPKPQASIKSRVAATINSSVDNTAPSQDLYNPESYTPILENLEVLHLGYNGIKSMMDLQVSRLTGLKALFLQGNEITKVEGLEGLQDLRELVLDRNKIKSITEISFMNQWNLQELHMEENRVKELDGLTVLENLQRLYLGMNRIQDISELEKMECLPNLIELSVVSNAVARRLIHRPMLVFRMPNLMIIDGIPVSDEERAKAELYFMDQQPPQITTTIEATLPGIGQYKTSIPVKVTNVQLASPDRSSWSGTIQYSDEPIAYDSRVRRRNNQQNPVTTAPSAISLASRTASSTYPMGSTQSTTSGQPRNGGTFGYQYGQQDYMSHGESLARLMSKSNRRL